MIKMVLKDGKTKVFTMSYDDGVVQDMRLIELMNSHGLKGTFNINTGKYLSEDATRKNFYGPMKLSEAKQIYIGSGQEIAVHTLSHPHLEQITSDEIKFEILEDMKNIKMQYGTVARGMAYPYGTYNDMVLDVLAQCQISYARTVQPTHSFMFPENWLMLHPTCHHRDKKLLELLKQFVENNNCEPEMFYLWGHSYEFDDDNNWDLIEYLAKYIGFRENIWYATNIEIYDYVQAYKSLQVDLEKGVIYNSSETNVWVDISGNIFSVESKSHLRL